MKFMKLCFIAFDLLNKFWAKMCLDLVTWFMPVVCRPRLLNNQVKPCENRKGFLWAYNCGNLQKRLLKSASDKKANSILYRLHFCKCAHL